MAIMKIDQDRIKKVRAQTGMGIMEVRNALVETDGNVEKAIEKLRIKSKGKAQKLATRETDNGTVQGYFHPDGSVGVMVEVQCNTDFVSSNKTFKEFARSLAMHIAWSNPQFVSAEQVPDVLIEKERAVFEIMVKDKPEAVRPKIVEGMTKKWLSEICLLEQEHINTEKFGKKTIDQLRQELSVSTGENIVIKRFSRFKVGE